MRILRIYQLAVSFVVFTKASQIDYGVDEASVASATARLLGVGLAPTPVPYEPPGFKPTTTPTDRTKKPTRRPTRIPTTPIPTRRPTAPYPCSLCRPGEDPLLPNQTIPFLNGEKTCAYVDKLGILTSKVGKENCQFYRLLGKVTCQCEVVPPPLPNTCRLCENGSSLPFPNRKILGGISCRSIQNAARRDLRSNCYKYQGSIGPLCGCRNPKTVDRVCHLCNTDSLPFPSRKVDGVTCRQYEFVASIDSTCKSTKAKVSAKCCRGA